MTTTSNPASAGVEARPPHQPDRAERVPHHPAPQSSSSNPLVPAFLVGAAGFAALVVLAIGAGVLLTDVLLPGSLQRWDQDVIDTLVGGRPGLNSWSLVGSYFAEAPVAIGLTVLLTVFCALRRRFEAAIFLVVALSMEGAVYLFTTYFVSRTRPLVHRLEQLIVSDSFFSGHVAASVVTWFGLAFVVWTMTRNRVPRAVACVPVVVAPVVVALSRMYRGMHYPTDAIAGYLVGWGCVLVALLVVHTYRAKAARYDVEPGADQ